MRARHRLAGAVLLLALGAAGRAHSGEIIVDFFAAPGTGFADNTPATPVGGNPGLTVGQQRIFVFLQAAAIWTEVLKPQQDIFVAAQFTALGPNVLGSAGARFIWSNFPGAELPNTWYFDSLADMLTQGDLSPVTYDIQANFSSNFAFYLGLDDDEPPGTADLLAVVLHEMAHGLNFANAVNELTGAIPTPAGTTEPFGDIYSQYTIDVTTGKGWNEMTAAERAASAVNVRKVSWSGRNVRLNQRRVLERGEPTVMVLEPSSLAGPLMLGTASFGPPLTAKGVTGDVVAAEDAADAAGPSVFDACTAILNDVSGRIALVDRGTCAFTVKAANAQAAGAIAILIGDNVLALPPSGLGGADPTIIIPAGRISQIDASSIRANLAAGVRANVRLDTSVRAGTDRVKRRVMLAALNPVQTGSSISHFEAVAFPNQLMEPAINPDLTSSVEPPEDLTKPLLTDLGWFTDRDGVLDGHDLCLRSDTSPTVVLGSCDSGVTNTVHETGCSVADALNTCDVVSRIWYVPCVYLVTSALRLDGRLTRSDQRAIVRCAGRH